MVTANGASSDIRDAIDMNIENVGDLELILTI